MFIYWKTFLVSGSFFGRLFLYQVHLLEAALLAKLGALETQNIHGLFAADQPRDRVINEMDNATDRLDEAVCL